MYMSVEGSFLANISDMNREIMPRVLLLRREFRWKSSSHWDYWLGSFFFFLDGFGWWWPKRVWVLPEPV